MSWQKKRAYDGKTVSERRRHVRIDDEIMLSIMNLSESSEESKQSAAPEIFHLVPVNISAVGMSFYTEKYLAEGTPVRVVMRFDDFTDSLHFPDGLITIEGVVVRVELNELKKINHIAIDFRYISPVAENTLAKILFLRERKQIAVGQVIY